MKTDEIDVGDEGSEKQHRYSASGARFACLEAAYEGDDDHIIIEDRGEYGAAAITFNISVNPNNDGVLLRRRSDQQTGPQRASVSVDGERVVERDWFYADRNPIKRWLDDEFVLPAGYTTGKSSLSISIIPDASRGEVIWNEFRYWVYSLL